jgi:uncharacterized protein (TIGR03790 family)
MNVSKCDGRQLAWLAATLLIATLAAAPAAAQTGENVLVVANATSPASNEIADYYAHKRQVPGDQVLRLQMPAIEEISRAVYELQIERPIASWLSHHSAQDRILYIVLTKDVPMRVSGSDGLQGTVASVDSELTLLYRKFCQITVPQAGSIKNPYFLNDASITTAKPFTHRVQDLYLVTRLDGFTLADVKALIDRAAAPATEGRILLDEKPEMTQSLGNRWLDRAATELRKMDQWRDRVVLDDGPKVLHGEPNVLGYYSWGSNDPLAFDRHLGLGFVNGAIGATFVSTDARTFQEPAASWTPGKTGQSLIGDLIRDGITGVAGHVTEPYLNATIRPDILFPAYLSGMNLAESFYLAMPFVSWQTVVIGDPLCAPFREKPLTKSDIDAGTDSATELPAILSQRRIAVLAATGVKPAAATAFVRGNVRLDRADRAGAREAFESAVKLDSNFWAAQFSLATLYEGSSEWDAAIDRYRAILARAPDNVLALNNLAYVLAVQKHDTANALPLAKRAHDLAKNLPPIADTLAWVQHLAGDDAAAEVLVVDAAKRMPQNADIRLHAAFVLAATGKSAQAATELAAAIKLNPELEQREDVRSLRTQLSAPKMDEVAAGSSAESHLHDAIRSQKVPRQRTSAAGSGLRLFLQRPIDKALTSNITSRV